MADTDEMIRIELVMRRDGRMNTTNQSHPSIDPVIAQTLMAGLLQRALSLYAREGYDEDESGGTRNG
jgi:hypothetical protein